MLPKIVFIYYLTVGYRKTEIWKTVDWFTIILYLLMIVAGWFTICGASFEFDSMGLFDINGRPGSQLMWVGVSMVVIFIILMLESDFFDVFAYLIYAAVIVLLIATIFLAPDIKGSHSWLKLGALRIQPAEFAKFATALAVAKFMNSYGFQLTTVKNFAITLMLIFLPMICIILQKETGSALVYFAFFLMLYREGMSGYILLAGICAVAFFVTTMKFSDVVVGATDMGELIVSSMILVISFLLVVMVRKDRMALQVMLGGTAIVYRFFVRAGKLCLGLDGIARVGSYLSDLSFRKELDLALCTDRRLCFGVDGLHVFGGLCVRRDTGTPSADPYQSFVGIGR